MTHSPAQVIKQWLVNQAIGFATPAASWGVYVAGLPEAGDEALCVYDTAGILQGRIQATGETIEAHGIQLRVRGSDYTTGRNKASAICTAFDALQNHVVTLSGSTYKVHAVTRKSPIVHLGPEANNKRERFTINFLATITQTA